MARTVHRTLDPQDAYLVRDLLQAHGIAARVAGADRTGLRGALPLDATELAVEVEVEENVERAVAVLEEMRAGAVGDAAAGDWLCGRCGEESPSTFDACWKCGRSREAASMGSAAAPYRGGAATVPAQSSPDGDGAVSTPDRASAAREAGALVFLALLPAALVMAFLGPEAPSGWTDARWAALEDVILVVMVGAPLLLLVRKSPALPALGLVKPRILSDTIGGVLLAALVLVPGLLLYGHPDVPAGGDLSAPLPASGADWAVLAPATLVSAFASALALQGYLLDRLAIVLRSRLAGVGSIGLLTALMSGTTDGTGLMTAACEGMLLAVAFLVARRIWPVALASALATLVLWAV